MFSCYVEGIIYRNRTKFSNHMKITREFDYRNAKSILKSTHPRMVKEIVTILNNRGKAIDLTPSGKQRKLSSQVQNYFLESGWGKEVASPSLPEMSYDLMKDGVAIEIELGHKRLVFADFFEFLADYSSESISAGVMIVASDSEKFGHKWHNSVASTQRKIESIDRLFLVPIWVIGIDP